MARLCAVWMYLGAAHGCGEGLVQLLQLLPQLLLAVKHLGFVDNLVQRACAQVARLNVLARQRQAASRWLLTWRSFWQL